MQNLEYDDLTVIHTLPSGDECVQIVANVAQLLVLFSDVRSAQERAYVIDGIARFVFRAHYETFVRRCVEIDKIPWETGIAPKWEGQRDEFGDPVFDADQERPENEEI